MTRILIVEDGRSQQNWLYNNLDEYECFPKADDHAYNDIREIYSSGRNHTDMKSLLDSIFKNGQIHPDLMILDVCLKSDEEKQGLVLLGLMRKWYPEWEFIPAILLTKLEMKKVHEELNQVAASQSYPKGMMTTFYIQKPEGDLARLQEDSGKSKRFKSYLSGIIETLVIWNKVSSPTLTFTQLLNSAETNKDLKDVLLNKLRPTYNLIAFLFEFIKTDEKALSDLASNVLEAIKTEIDKKKGNRKIFDMVYDTMLEHMEHDTIVQSDSVQKLRGKETECKTALEHSYNQTSLRPFINRIKEYTIPDQDARLIMKHAIKSFVDFWSGNF